MMARTMTVDLGDELREFIESLKNQVIIVLKVK